MKKLSLSLAVVVLSGFIIGCPNTSTAVASPYVTAHTVINQASLALTVAEGIFNQWVYSQTDEKKIQKAQLTFAKVKTLVASGLKLAHDGVYIAEQAKQAPDVVRLLLQADNAWDDLRQFLVYLLDGGTYNIVVEAAVEPDDEEHPPPAGVSVRVLAMTSTMNPIDALPVSIIPDL